MRTIERKQIDVRQSTEGIKPQIYEPDKNCECGGYLTLTRKHMCYEEFVCPTCSIKWRLGGECKELTNIGINKRAPGGYAKRRALGT